MVERHRILRVTVIAVLLSTLPAGSATGLSLSPQSSALSPQLEPQSSVLSPESLSEPHLANIRQLTAGGKNAEAYFSHDGRKLIFQSTNNWTTGESATWPLSINVQLGC